MRCGDENDAQYTLLPTTREDSGLHLWYLAVVRKHMFIVWWE